MYRLWNLISKSPTFFQPQLKYDSSRKLYLTYNSRITLKATIIQPYGNCNNSLLGNSLKNSIWNIQGRQKGYGSSFGLRMTDVQGKE